MPLPKKLAMREWIPTVPTTPEYRKLDEESSSDFTPYTQQSIPSEPSKIWKITRVATVGLFNAACLFAFVWWPSRILSAGISPVQKIPDLSAGTDHLESVHHCGRSIEEAKKLGCTWDLLAGSWLPQRCIDQELTDEFRAAGDWHFYVDKNGTEELMESELQYRVGPGMDYYTTLEYHRTHCSFQWRKMHRAMQSGGRIENALANYEHTLHCGFVFLQDGDLQDLLTEISVEFFYC